MAEGNPLYVEFFKLLKDKRRAQQDHELRLSGLARKFCADVHDRLGFPELSFQSLDGSYFSPWVRLYEYESGKIKPVNGPIVGRISDDGALSFAIGVALSSELNSYPKFYFWAAYTLSLDGPDGPPVLREIDGEQRAYKILTNGFSVVIEDFLSAIKQSLDPKTPYGPTKKSSGIGFLAMD